MTFHRLATADTDDTDYVLRHFDHSKGKVVVRDRYRDLVCHNCGKLPELTALVRGLDGDIVINTKRDAFESLELLTIVSARCRAFLETLSGALVDYHELPGCRGNLFVAMPHLLLPAVEGHPGFNMLSACGACKRRREITWGPEPVALNEEYTLGAYMLENRMGMMPTWFANDTITRAITELRPRLTGWHGSLW